MAVRDVAVIGGGIVGLATAREWLTRLPGASLQVLEKEPVIGAHQTSHNSGVIHSGIAYRPGSLKAATCVQGARLLVEFCQAQSIPYKLCGKVVVAVEASDVPILERLYEWGRANGVAGLSLVGPERLRELEPHARGLRALHVASAGLIDYHRVAQAMAEDVQRRGGIIQTAAEVRQVRRDGSSWRLLTTKGEVSARFLITCAGLYADRVAAMAGVPRAALRIIPFRGEYYELVPHRRDLVRHMIYPVPDPALPFLGAHVTRDLEGRVHAGPNAVLALKREGYRKTDVHLGELAEMLSFRGFWKMTTRYWRVGLEESLRSWSRRAFVRRLQRLVPEVQVEDVIPDGSGVRAQAVDRTGALMNDFELVSIPHALAALNVPSPAATACLAVAQVIVDRASSAWGWPESRKA